MWFFKPSEVAKIAMDMERNGQAFYSAIAEKTNDPDTKNLFSFMSSEEASHLNTFEEFSKKFASYEFQSLGDDYEEYVRELVDSSVFGRGVDPAELASGIKNPIEAIDLALQLEKDTIVFYLQFKKMVPPEEKFAIDNIIEEENHHISRLLFIKKSLMATSDDFYKPSDRGSDAEK